MPHEVGWGVGGGGAYHGAEVHTGRQRLPEGTNARRQGRPRLQTCVDRPTEQLSRPDFQQEVSPMPSPSIVCTGSAHRVVLSHPYGDSQCRLLSYQSSQERQTSWALFGRHASHRGTSEFTETLSETLTRNIRIGQTRPTHFPSHVEDDDHSQRRDPEQVLAQQYHLHDSSPDSPTLESMSQP